MIKLSTFKFNNALNVYQDKHWRYCPACAQEDEQKYGTTYLHVSHQCFYKRVCSKHNALLERIDACHFSLPPTNSEPNLASQRDIEKDAALLHWVTELTNIPPEERKLRALNLLRQKVCVYTYDRKTRIRYGECSTCKMYLQSALTAQFILITLGGVS
ncbi:TniQ family protein [Pseudoalteromonas sp. SaAl2]